jgi:hypothetical protein
MRFATVAESTCGSKEHAVAKSKISALECGD